MEINIRSELKNLLIVVFLTFIVFMIIALGLAFITGEFDLLIFSQILVYPTLISASVFFFRATFNVKNDNSFLGIAFFTALIARIIVVIILYYLLIELQGHPFLGGFKDESMYHSISSYFAKNPQVPLSDVNRFGLSDNYGMYPYLVGFFYRCFGIHTLVARFLNAFIGALCVIPFYLFVRNLGMKQETAKLAAAFYVFSANFILFNSIQLKDSLTLLLCFLLVYLGSLLMKTKRISRVVLLTGMYLVISLPFLYIRGEFFFLFAVYYLIFVYKRFFNKLSLDFSRILIITLVVAMLFLVCWRLIPEISSRMGKFSGNYIEYAFLRYEKWQILDLFGSLIPIITSVTGFFLPLPSLISFPCPDSSYLADVFENPSHTEIFFISIISLITIFASYKIKKMGFNVILYLATILYISLLVTGYVTYPRHKLFLTALCLIVAAYGIVETKIKFRIVLPICVAGWFFVFIYNLLRFLARA